MATCLAWASLAAAQPAAPGSVGQPQAGAPGVQETSGQIMARDRLQAVQLRERHSPPRHVLPPQAVGVGAAPGTPSPVSPLAPQTVSAGVNFTAATFSDCSGWPPDTMGAVGPSQFIIALNGRIRSFNKASGLADGGIDANTDVFFSSVLTPGANFSTDPRIRYDRLSGRWFVIMIDVPGQQGNLPNRVMIAVSNSGVISPSTVWTFFQFAGDATNFADYPTLGIDANALYIGANIFSTSGSGAFVNTSAFVVRKSSLLSGGPIVVTAFTGLISGGRFNKVGPYTPQGVDNYDPAATEGYFIGIDFTSASTLQLRRVSNPGGTPTLSGNVSIAVPTFAAPIAVTVQGTSGTVDGLDERLLAAHLRNGSLWTSQNVGVNSSGGTTSPDRNGARWYQLSGIPTGQTPSVVQSGTVFQSGAANLSYWMGTIMVSGQGHAAMGFTAAGPNNFLNAATTGRLAGDAPGAMGAPATYTASTAAYNPTDGTSPHRWGDYSYTSLDPSDDMTLWTIQEWCQSAGNGYAVQVAKLLAPPPALPANCTPATLTQAMANVSVVLQGSAAGGAGFFEPGVSFPNHLTAAVNGGGVTVNSVVYNTPTNLTLNLTVAANASTGPRTVTITNPDGQAVTSAAGLLTIASPANQPPTLAAIANRTVTVGVSLLITNVASDPDGDQLTFSLGPGAAANATINATSGLFSWTPGPAQVGTNLFSVIVTDSGVPSLSATQSFSVTVLQTNRPPTLAAIPNQSLYVLSTLVWTNVASDPDAPPQVLTFSLDAGAPAGASIGASSGILVWTPTQAQLGSNSLTVRVTDNGQPPLSASATFVANVLPPPVLLSPSVSSNLVSLTWNAIAGKTYRVQYKTNLSDPAWVDVSPDILAMGPMAGTTQTNLNPLSFYRLLVVP